MLSRVLHLFIKKDQNTRLVRKKFSRVKVNKFYRKIIVVDYCKIKKEPLLMIKDKKANKTERYWITSICKDEKFLSSLSRRDIKKIFVILLKWLQPPSFIINGYIYRNQKSLINGYTITGKRFIKSVDSIREKNKFILRLSPLDAYHLGYFLCYEEQQKQDKKRLFEN